MIHKTDKTCVMALTAFMTTTSPKVPTSTEPNDGKSVHTKELLSDGVKSSHDKSQKSKFQANNQSFIPKGRIKHSFR